MKILQLNIWCGRLGKQIVEVIQREDPDMVCLQEVIELPGGQSFLFDDLDELKAKTKYPHASFVPHFGFKLMNRQARTGLLIMSKLPFLETSSTFTRLDYMDDFDTFDMDYNIRSLQHVVVDHNGERLHVLNHHGHHINQHKNGDAETMRQCGMIAEYVKKLKGPVVLCGDFNLAPASESLELINRTLVNHAKERGVVTTRTPLTHKTEVCDYIFTSPGVAIVDFQVLDDIASDHKALLVEF